MDIIFSGHYSVGTVITFLIFSLILASVIYLQMHIQIKKQKMKVKKSYALYMSFLAGLVAFVVLLLLPAVTNQFNQFWADIKKMK